MCSASCTNFSLTFLFLYIQPITEDDVERLSVCLRVLAERNELMSSVFAQGSRQVFADMLSLREEQDNTSKKVRVKVRATDNLASPLPLELTKRFELQILIITLTQSGFLSWMGGGSIRLPPLELTNLLMT